MPHEIIEGFAYLKKAAAYTNCDSGILSMKSGTL
jgi:fumarate hydratase class II